MWYTRIEWMSIKKFLTLSSIFHRLLTPSIFSRKKNPRNRNNLKSLSSTSPTGKVMKIIQRNSFKITNIFRVFISHTAIAASIEKQKKMIQTEWNSIVDVRWMKEKSKSKSKLKNIVFRDQSPTDWLWASVSTSLQSVVLRCYVSALKLSKRKEKEMEWNEANNTRWCSVAREEWRRSNNRAADNLIDCFLCLIYLFQTMANEPCIRGGFTFY